MRTERCAAVVVAAGQGKRMGGNLQKQFLSLGGKPVLYYALRCLEDSAYIDEVILVTGAESIDYCRGEIVERFGFSKVKEIVAGGKERYDSVYEGLKHCREAKYVFIHDGARPFLTEEILERGYESVREYGACAAGVPSKDTVKILDRKQNVVETPLRELVWSVQTPQVFRYELIRQAYDRLQMFDKTGITDDAMVVEEMGGHTVHMFRGDYRNLKITTPEDLPVAEQLLHEEEGH